MRNNPASIHMPPLICCILQRKTQIMISIATLAVKARAKIISIAIILAYFCLNYNYCGFSIASFLLF